MNHELHAIDATWKLHHHQLEPLLDITSPARAVVTGFGGGKTYCGARWALHRSSLNPVGVPTLCVEPTFRMVRRVMLPTFVEALEETGCQYAINKADYTLTWNCGREIWLASGELPHNLSGTNIGCAWIDEAALQEEEVNRRVSSRLRDPRANIRQLLYTSTHEGLGWFYRATLKIPTRQVPSWANTSLPKDQLDRLKAIMVEGSPRWRMYVLGDALQISGNIYTNFQQANLSSCENLEAGPTVLGWDFNVDYQVTVIAKWRSGVLHVCGEVVTRGGTTTEEHAARVADWLLQRKLAIRRGNNLLNPDSGEQIEAYVDASGSKRTTNATKSDHYHVRSAGFWPIAQSANPLVRDRISAVQSALARKRLLLDPQAAPLAVQALREHAYEVGTDPPKPRKRWGADDVPLDHACDSIGYLVWGLMPVRLQASLVTSNSVTPGWLEAAGEYLRCG